MPLKQTTRERLIEAGSEVFGALGFKSATIRRISKLAGVPIGSINYHFGDKEGLYYVILEQVFTMAFERYPLDLGQGEEATLEERLYHHIRTVLYRMLGEGGIWADAGKGRLLARELADPSPVVGRLEEKFIRPAQRQLLGIVKEFLGPGVDEFLVMDCAQCIIGQVLRRVYPPRGATALTPEEVWDTVRIEQLANLITTFSLGGLHEVKRQRKGSEK